jgi:hypothetical protein
MNRHRTASLHYGDSSKIASPIDSNNGIITTSEASAARERC